MKSEQEIEDRLQKIMNELRDPSISLDAVILKSRAIYELSWALGKRG